MPKPGHPFDPLPIAGNRIQRRHRVLGEAFYIEASVLEREGLRIKNERCAYVHRGGLALDIEEGGVESA